MFFPGSRYLNAPTVTVTLQGGAQARAVVIPFRPAPTVAGFHRRLQGQRLDLIASYHLSNATQFWRVCDANDGIVPGAIAARDLIAIPTEES